jgi:hypothetical protein
LKRQSRQPVMSSHIGLVARLLWRNLIVEDLVHGTVVLCQFIRLCPYPTIAEMLSAVALHF